MRLFVLLSRFPYPLEKGDKLRAFHQLRILSEKHEIFLCALHENELEQKWKNEVGKYCKRLETVRLSKTEQLLHLGLSFFGSEPFQVAYFYKNSGRKNIENWIADWKPNVIYCQLLRTVRYVENIEGIPKVLDFQDVFSKGIERRLETDPWYYRPILNSEVKRLANYEKKVFQLFDHCTIISEQDRDQLPFAGKNKVTIVRNGVQLDVFKPREAEKTVDVLFAGNMGYPPNIEGAVFLEKEVMPLVRKKRPKTTLMLAGTTPTTQVKELAGNLTEVTGWVSDMRDCYAASKVFVAPMNIGTGLQNKLLEAMAMQIPCITSSLANNALKAIQDKEILIAKTAQEYADHILQLLDEEEKADRIALAGHQMVADKFSWETMTEPLLTVLDGIVLQP